MKPIAYFFTNEKMDKRYNKKLNKITEQQAVKWIAEDIVRYIIKHNKSTIDILICDYASEDDFWNDCTLKQRPYYIKRDKTRMAYYKFKMDIAFQERIIEYIKSCKDIDVKEETQHFSSWKRIDNYKKTVVISAK
jgi:hypothetical protein